MRNKKMKRIAMIGIATLMTAITAQASLMITIEESGDDVTFTCTGTANITGMGRIGFNSTHYYAQVYPSTGGVFNWNPGHHQYVLNGELPAYGTYNSAFQSYGTSPGDISGFLIEGDTFGLAPQAGSIDRFYVPYNYVSGTQIDGKLTMLNTSFAALGITSGISYSQTFNSGENLDSITTQAIPEPATALSLLIGGGLLAAFRRVKKAYGLR